MTAIRLDRRDGARGTLNQVGIPSVRPIAGMTVGFKDVAEFFGLQTGFGTEWMSSRDLGLVRRVTIQHDDAIAANQPLSVVQLAERLQQVLRRHRWQVEVNE